MVRVVVRCLVSIGCLAACLTYAPEIYGQGARTPSFGFWMGGASMPHGLDPGCGYVRQQEGMLNVGAFVVVPAGPVALEGRVGGHSGSGSAICTEAPLYQLGVRTERVAVLPSGGFPAIDLRVRWLPAGDGAVQVAAGAGWAGAAKDIPYFNAGVGGQLPAGAAHIGIDLELTGYRVPWIERTVEVTEDGELETSRRHFEEWAPSLGIRMSVEFPIGGAGTARSDSDR